MKQRIISALFGLVILFAVFALFETDVYKRQGFGGRWRDWRAKNVGAKFALSML